MRLGKSKSSAKPFAGHGTKTFLGLVRNLEKEARIVSPDSDDALCRAAAVKAVLLGFTCLGQLASTLEVDVLDFIPSPATRALFMHMVDKATERHAAYKKPKDFVLEAQASHLRFNKDAAWEAMPSPCARRRSARCSLHVV